MPHCIIEYAKELEQIIQPKQLNHAVFLGALKSELFEQDDIKLRAIAYEHHQTGNEKINFVHITVRLLSGRSTEQKKQLSHLILTESKKLQLMNISLTVEITEINRDTYCKLVV